jgi:hypothetical protein
MVTRAFCAEADLPNLIAGSASDATPRHRTRQRFHLELLHDERSNQQPVAPLDPALGTSAAMPE